MIVVVVNSNLGFYVFPLQAELDVDSDTPGTSTGHRVRGTRVQCPNLQSQNLRISLNLFFSLPGSRPEF